MAIIVIVLQQIDANIINPKIIGNLLEISPIIIIFSITVIELPETYGKNSKF